MKKSAANIRALVASMFSSPTKVEVHGSAFCRVEGFAYRPLHRCLSRMRGVTFARKPRYFWTGLGVYAEFDFRGHVFLIERDAFDDALWIASKDKLAHPEEIHSISEHIKSYMATV